MNAENYKYFAFISYSHADAKWADWLHRSLEKFTIPKSLRKVTNTDLPKSLYPIFKDREELPSASALGDHISRALIASRYLIVICSPEAAHSDWVNEEVSIFKSLGRSDRVLCLIVDGEPSVSDNFSHRPEKYVHPLRRASDAHEPILRQPVAASTTESAASAAKQECFPPAIRYKIGPDKQILPDRANPIAADVRDGKDGKSLALSKLIAGMLNVDLFQLTQRQNQRRVNRLRVLAVMMLLLVTAFASIAVQAWLAQKKAEELSLVALSRQLSTHANTLLESDKSLRVNMLLAGVQAHEFAPTIEAQSAALKTLLATRSINTLLTADAAILRIAYNAQGNLLAAATEKGHIQIWDVERSALRYPPLVGHNGNVVALAFSPDGTRLLSGGVDETVRVWDLSAAQDSAPPTVATLDPHNDWVVAVDFAADGSTFASAGWDGRVILWDPVSLTPVTELALGNHGWASAIHFSSDGKWLAIGREDGTVEIWHMATHTLADTIANAHNGWVTDVRFSHNSQLLATTSSDGTLGLWDMDRNAMRFVVSSDDGSGFTSVSFSQDDQLLITGGWDRKVSMWQVASGQQYMTPLLGHSEQVTSVAVAPDGQAFASAGHDGAIVLWQPDETYPFKAHRCSHTSPITSVAYHPGGTRIATASMNNGLQLCELSGNDAPQQPIADSSSRSLTFSRDGQHLAFISNAHQVVQYDLAAQAPLADSITLPANVITQLAYSPDNQLLAIGDRNANVHLWRRHPTQQVTTLQGHQGPIRDLTFSEDSKTLASAAEDGQIVLWDLRTGAKKMRVLRANATPVTAIAFHPASSHILASGSEDGTLTFWQVATAAPIGAPITVHDGAVNALSFSMDGSLIATGGRDRQIALRDTRTHRQIGPKLAAHADQITALAFSPLTDTLVSGGADGAIMVWDVDIDHWKARLCDKVAQPLTQREWTLYVSADLPYQDGCHVAEHRAP